MRENIMALARLGNWGLFAPFQTDYLIFLIFVLWGAGILMMINLIVDVLYAVVDPRVHYV
jgi:ABC-type dipeptide/oligopeptide/nickel transport system permease component